jgi:hypothetical protein
MAWYVTTDGKNVIGPYEDQAIISEIHKGLKDFKIRWVSSDTWRDGASHAPFLKALKTARRKQSGTTLTVKLVLVGVAAFCILFLLLVGSVKVRNWRWEQCRSSDRCTEFGQCHVDWYSCEAQTNDDCKQSRVCTEQGKCSEVGGECVPGGVAPGDSLAAKAQVAEEVRQIWAKYDASPNKDT